jgi:hypothetical protein
MDAWQAADTDVSSFGRLWRPLFLICGKAVTIFTTREYCRQSQLYSAVFGRFEGERKHEKYFIA